MFQSLPHRDVVREAGKDGRALLRVRHLGMNWTRREGATRRPLRRSRMTPTTRQREALGSA